MLLEVSGVRVCSLLGAVAIAMLPAAALCEPPRPVPVQALFANPAFSDLAISDDGTQLAYLRSKGDLRVVFAHPVAGGDAVALVKFDDPETLPNRLVWANDRRILISAHARDPNSIGMRNRYTRVFGVDSDGTNFEWLGRDWPLHGQRALQSGSQDALVHLTPDDPQTVLLEYWSRIEDSPQVMRMDVDTGKLSIAEKRQHDIYDWYADRDGAVRAGVSTHGETYKLWARTDASEEFQLVAERDKYEWGGLQFAGFHRDPGTIYVADLKDGRLALFEFDLAKRAIGRLVEANAEVDVRSIEVLGSRREAVGVSYTDDRRRVRYFDERMQAEFSRLRATLENELGRTLDVDTVGASTDGTRLVLEVSSDLQPPVYYFYDRNYRRILPLFAAYPDVPVDALAPTRRVTFRARDGLSIPAYLTLPPGLGQRALPAVALVHGGPWARDRIAWDPEVQLLASRGFAVLQVNYRGSSGFGKAFIDAGNREWGQKIQDDITDGVRWLIAEGIADADRVAIMGASYGGYATLVGLVKTPELYRAGVAYAAVTDIEDMLSDDRWYGNRDEFHRRLIGGERGDSERLRESSPLRRAAEIEVPVLLGHGVDDQRVHVRQSQDMAAALKAAGADYEYMEFPDEVHGFALEANRIRWYTRVADFLEANLAPRAAAGAN
jgi:acetyl esterase/lipase